MANKPTTDEIQVQILKLEEIKPTILRWSISGDDHHSAIDAQIRVLHENMSESKIYDWIWRYYTPEEDSGQNILDAALEARMWLDGEELNDPDCKDLADSWKELVRK